MNLSEAKKLILFCESKNIKRVKSGEFEAEFFEKKEIMNLDPKKLAETLSDSMPPDSAMLFASSEDILPEPQPAQMPEPESLE